MVSLCQLEKFCLQISFILTTHGFNHGFKIMRILSTYLSLWKRNLICGSASCSSVLNKNVSICFVKKSSNSLCCIIKLPVGGKKKSEAKAELSMIWPVLREIIPQVLLHVVSPYWKREYYCLVYTNYYE